MKVGRIIEKVCHNLRMCIMRVNCVEHDIATGPSSVCHIIYQFEVFLLLS